MSLNRVFSINYKIHVKVMIPPVGTGYIIQIDPCTRRRSRQQRASSGYESCAANNKIYECGIPPKDDASSLPASNVCCGQPNLVFAVDLRQLAFWRSLNSYGVA